MLINNPTRHAENCIPTLLDHVYINITKHTTKSGVCIFEILDHLPTFFIVKNTKCFSDAKTTFIRNIWHFITETFLIDLDSKLSSLSQEFSSETNTASAHQV